MGAGAAVNYSDLPAGATVLPPASAQSYSDLPQGATVLTPPTSMPRTAHLADEVGDLLAGAARNAAKISGPHVVYEGLRKAVPQLGLKPVLGGMPTTNEALANALPAILGAEEVPDIPTSATESAGTGSLKSAASVLDHPGVSPWVDYLKNKIPGAQLLKTTVASAKGLMEGNPEAPPAPAIPSPSPPATATAPPATIPTTNGVPWGQIIPQRYTPPQVEQALNDALGGQPLKPNVPLRMQVPGATGTASSLPKGFTPVESSALKGYKYDPSTREFESITAGGQHYIHGDVSPEEAQAFADADSKGRAWVQIRQNPLVAKVVNGQRVPVKIAPLTATPEGNAERTPLTLPTTDDLLEKLKQSLIDAGTKK